MSARARASSNGRTLSFGCRSTRNDKAGTSTALAEREEPSKHEGRDFVSPFLLSYPKAPFVCASVLAGQNANYRQRTAAFERVSKGDALLCYIVRLSRWCGALEVASEAFEDVTPIFAEANDPFPIRFKVTPRIILDFERSIPIQEQSLWERL